MSHFLKGQVVKLALPHPLPKYCSHGRIIAPPTPPRILKYFNHGRIIVAPPHPTQSTLRDHPHCPPLPRCCSRGSIIISIPPLAPHLLAKRCGHASIIIAPLRPHRKRNPKFPRTFSMPAKSRNDPCCLRNSDSQRKPPTLRIPVTQARFKKPKVRSICWACGS